MSLQPTTFTVSRRRRRRWWLWAPAFVLLLALGGGYAYLQHLGLRPGAQVMAPFQPPFGGRQQVTVLILGVDGDSEPRRSDTMMLAMVDLAHRRLGVLSVPRDLRVAIPGHDTEKINSAYTLGGVPLAAQTVANLTRVPVDYHIKITSSGLKKLVDTLGGVEVDVDKLMRYTDRSQRLFINLRPGRQRLNGEQAVGFVRFRYDRMGDLTRIGRQQAFVRAVLQQGLAARNLARLPSLLSAFAQTVETDLTLRDLRAIGDLAKGMEPGHMTAATLPGAPVMISHISYLEPDYAAIKGIVEQTLYGVPPRVAIVNATAVPGAEQPLVQQLGGEGYKLAEVRFAANTSAVSQIMDAAQHAQAVEQIHHWLKCGKVTRADGDAVPDADITVLLGTDYIGRQAN